MWISKNSATNYYVLSKFESVKIYWLSVKFDWFKYLKRGYCKSVKFLWLFQWKLTDFTVKNIFFTDESVKRQITDSISQNLTDSDLESIVISILLTYLLFKSESVRFSLKLNQWSTSYWSICDFWLAFSEKSLIDQSEMGHWFNFSDNLTDSDLESNSMTNF